MKHTILPLLSLMCLATASVVSGAERVVTVHFAAPAAQPPVIDGKLDDTCWATAPRTTTMYSFYSTDPVPADSRSEFKLVYDTAGVYLAVRCYEDDMAGIKASITQRGDGSLWTDDSLEMYLDPTATATGFRKFIVNTLGTQTGLLQMDGANVDHAWNPDGWQVAIGKDEKSWTAELFFPRQDLGRPAKAGDLWRFALCRFGWGGGKLTPATSAPGAKFFNPGAFGWLYFLKENTFDPPSIGAELGKQISGDWLLPLGTEALAQRGGKVHVVQLSQPVVEAAARVGRTLVDARALPGATGEASTKELAEIEKAASAVPRTITDAAVFSQAMLDLTRLEGRLEDVAFGLKRDALLSARMPGRL